MIRGQRVETYVLQCQSRPALDCCSHGQGRARQRCKNNGNMHNHDLQNNKTAEIVEIWFRPSELEWRCAPAHSQTFRTWPITAVHVDLVLHLSTPNATPSTRW